MYTDITTIPPFWLAVLPLLLVWELVWKAFALWRAARRTDKVWFIILIIINSVGILPIVYLLLTNNNDGSRRR